MMKDCVQEVSDHACLRVLVLDDDVFILSCVREMLEEIGHVNIVTATDGRHALDLLATQSFDLVICDLSMPEMDGVEFLRFAAAQSYQGSVLLHTGMDVAVRRAAERLAEAHGLHILGAYNKIIERA